LFLFFVFSILLHILGLLLFLKVGITRAPLAIPTLFNPTLSHEEIIQIKHERKKRQEEILKRLQTIAQEKKKDLPAQLRARKSNFGWVLFDSSQAPTKPMPVIVPTTLDGDIGQAPHTLATEGQESRPAPSIKIPLKTTQPAIQTPIVPAHPIPEQIRAQKHKQKNSKLSKNLTHKHPKNIPVTTIKTHEKAPVIKPVIKKITREIPVTPLPVIEKTKNIAHEHLEHKESPQAQQAQHEHVTPKTPAHELERPVIQAPQNITQDITQKIRPEEIQEEPDDTPVITSNKQDISESSSDLQKRIQAIEALQDKLARAGQAGVEHVPTENIRREASADGQTVLIGGPGGIRVRGAKNMTGERKRTMFALMKGFVEKIHGPEGQDSLDRDGDPNKKPSFEELKYLSYETKINWCLQSSWKQNFAYRPMASPHEGKAVIEFTLDEHGQVTQSKILQSTGYQDLDMIIIKNLQFASPFPPLPKHFGTKNYTTGRVIHVYTDRLGF
jgi:TonB family protein